MAKAELAASIAREKVAQIEKMAEANLHVRVLIKYDDYWWIHSLYYDPKLLFFKKDINSEWRMFYGNSPTEVHLYENSVKNFDFAICLLRKRYQERVLILITTESRDQVKCLSIV